MDRDFWLGLWAKGRVPFHGHSVNPLLVRHLPTLSLAQGARIFVPLCGQTVDIGWLRARGYRAVGAELSPLAVEQLFDSLGERPEVVAIGPLRRHSARDVVVFEGDIFDLTRELLGPVQAVYDRAALIALPRAVRARYAAHLVALTDAAPQLLSSFVHGEDPDGGPPFPVGEDEIRSLYGATHRITKIGDLRDGDDNVRDQVWWLDRPGT